MDCLRNTQYGRSMYVTVDGVDSDSADVNSGVPQGSVLGPVVFLIFVNHLCKNLKCKYALFADDLKLFSVVSNATEIAIFQ